MTNVAEKTMICDLRFLGESGRDWVRARSRGARKKAEKRARRRGEDGDVSKMDEMERGT